VIVEQFHATRFLNRPFNIGLGEIRPLEKKRFSEKFGQSICEAVAEIEPRAMIAFPEAAVGFAGEGDLLNVHQRGKPRLS
jgi:hypothetical protein